MFNTDTILCSICVRVVDAQMLPSGSLCYSSTCVMHCKGKRFTYWKKNGSKFAICCSPREDCSVRCQVQNTVCPYYVPIIKGILRICPGHLKILLNELNGAGVHFCDAITAVMLRYLVWNV